MKFEGNVAVPIDASRVKILTQVIVLIRRDSLYIIL